MLALRELHPELGMGLRAPNCDKKLLYVRNRRIRAMEVIGGATSKHPRGMLDEIYNR